MLTLFKPEFLRKHLKFEGLDMSFIDEGGQDWWYVYDLVGFLVEIARRLSPEKWAVLSASYQDWVNRRQHDGFISKAERKRVLLKFLTDIENLPSLLIVALANDRVLRETFSLKE